MKSLVETIVKALVDEPEAVEVTEVQGQHSCVVELKVASDDIGKVIGKRGVHAQAIRTLMTAAGGKKKKRPTTFWDVLFWIAAGGAVLYLLLQQLS